MPGVAVLPFICALLLASSGCTVPMPTPPLDCQSGTHEDPGTHTCVANQSTQSSVTIQVGPDGYNPAQCLKFTPNPVSVKAGQGFVFYNAGQQSVTIMGYPNTPWATVDPGQRSAALKFDAAGIHKYGIRACTGQDLNTWYGEIDVTVG